MFQHLLSSHLLVPVEFTFSYNSLFDRVNTNQHWFVQFAIKSLSHLILSCIFPCHFNSPPPGLWQWQFLIAMELPCHLLVLWQCLSRGATEIWSRQSAMLVHWSLMRGCYLWRCVLNYTKFDIFFLELLVFFYSNRSATCRYETIWSKDF